jgi:hypothetical protein
MRSTLRRSGGSAAAMSIGCGLATALLGGVQIEALLGETER